MESWYVILGILVIIGIISNNISKRKREARWSENEDGLCQNQTIDKSEDDNNQEETEVNNSNDKQPDTIGLMFNTLSALGCQPTKNDDGSLSVSYQGENFHMEFGGMYARVWDPMWSGIKADDPELPEVREAVNAANFNFGPTVVMSAPDDEGVIGFHSRRDIMLHPSCPDNVPFVKAVLDSFFDAKENVRTKFQQLKSQQMEQKANRRPVGFNTSATKKDN